MMGHLNNFSASGVGNLNKFSKNSNARGVARGVARGLPGGGCLSFDLTDTYCKIMQMTHDDNSCLMSA